MKWITRITTAGQMACSQASGLGAVSGRTIASNGTRSQRNGGCRKIEVSASTSAVRPPVCTAARRSGAARQSAQPSRAMPAPAAAIGPARRRRAGDPCSAMLLRTNEAPSRWSERVVSNTQSESARSHGDAPKCSRERSSVQSSTLKRTGSWVRSSLY